MILRFCLGCKSDTGDGYRWRIKTTFPRKRFRAGQAVWKAFWGGRTRPGRGSHHPVAIRTVLLCTFQ
jgi:hypothetical protein